MNNYSIGFDDPNALSSNNGDSIPYGDPVTTHNPMYNPASQMPSSPVIEFQPADNETSKISPFGSRNKINDHKTPQKERNINNREKVYIFTVSFFFKKVLYFFFQDVLFLC